MRGAGLRWDFGLAAHAALTVTLRVGAPGVAGLRETAAPLDGPAAVGWTPAVARAAVETIQAHFKELYQRALCQHDLVAAPGAPSLAMRAWRSLRHAQRRSTAAAVQVAVAALQALRAADAGRADWVPELAGLCAFAVLPDELLQRATHRAFFTVCDTKPKSERQLKT